jgi:hypothetical protein
MDLQQHVLDERRRAKWTIDRALESWCTRRKRPPAIAAQSLGEQASAS